MDSLEVRASVSLASLFGLRMLGLFIIMPVFSIDAERLAGGDNEFLVGLAIGIFGLTQALFQLPFGAISDRVGRKPVIVVGLLVFALGSFIAAGTQDIHWVIVGRALQGAGAISAVVMALLADLTREESRTRAMAAVGVTIGLSFAVSIMVATPLYRLIGMDGLFALIGVLALLGLGLTVWVVPPEPPWHRHAPRGSAPAPALFDRQLAPIHLGTFALQTVQTALFIVIPPALVHAAGLAVADQWKLYLPVVLVSFAFMRSPIRYAERTGRVKAVWLASAVVVVLSQLAFVWVLDSLWGIALALLAYFAAYNLLASILPSMAARLAPAGSRGAAIGVYNTMQSLGSFAGGALGGWMMKHYGGPAVFASGVVLLALWLFVLVVPMRLPAGAAAAVPGSSAGA